MQELQGVIKQLGSVVLHADSEGKLLAHVMDRWWVKDRGPDQRRARVHLRPPVGDDMSC